MEINTDLRLEEFDEVLKQFMGLHHFKILQGCKINN